MGWAKLRGIVSRITTPDISTSGTVPPAQLGTGAPTGSKYLRDDGTWQVPPGGGGATAVKLTTVTLPNNTLDHEQTITDAEVSATSRITIWVAPHDDTDENGPEALDVIALYARPAAGSFVATLSLRTKAAGAIKLHYTIGAP